MNVEELIEKLKGVAPDAHVVLEGPREDECFSARELTTDDSGSFVMLLRGKALPVTVED
jgi:hypothetical protein